MNQKKKSRHIYSTYALIILGAIILVGAIAAFSSSDIDQLCNVDNTFLGRTSGTWGCAIPASSNNGSGNITGYSSSDGTVHRLVMWDNNSNLIDAGCGGNQYERTNSTGGAICANVVTDTDTDRYIYTYTLGSGAKSSDNTTVMCANFEGIATSSTFAPVWGMGSSYKVPGSCDYLFFETTATSFSLAGDINITIRENGAVKAWEKLTITSNNDWHLIVNDLGYKPTADAHWQLCWQKKSGTFQITNGIFELICLEQVT